MFKILAPYTIQIIYSESVKKHSMKPTPMVILYINAFKFQNIFGYRYLTVLRCQVPMATIMICQSFFFTTAAVMICQSFFFTMAAVMISPSSSMCKWFSLGLPDQHISLWNNFVACTGQTNVDEHSDIY